MNDILTSIANTFNQLNFNPVTITFYSGLIVIAIIVFYVIDTPWRKAREAEAIRQKNRNKLKLEALKRFYKERKEKVKNKEEDAKESQKRIIEKVVRKAEIKRQVLKEVLNEKQTTLTQLDIDAIEQQIHTELLDELMNKMHLNLGNH